MAKLVVTINETVYEGVSPGSKLVVTVAEKVASIGVDDPDLVHTTGDEEIDGIKTFLEFPLTPEEAPTTDYQVANKKYVDDQLATAGGQDSAKIIIEDEFVRTSGSNLGISNIEWTNRSTGTGASAIPYATNESGHTGLIKLAPGTTTSGWGTMSGPDNTDQVEVADGDIVFEVIVKTPSAISDGTDTYTLRFGLNNSNAGAGNNTVYVRYSHGVNSGKWQFVHNRAGTETTIDSGITVAASTWYKLKFTVTGAAQAFEAFVDGNSVGTATPATPIAAGNRQGIILSNVKSAGTTDRPCYVDYIYFEQNTGR
jgi:hypothetical protein